MAEPINRHVNHIMFENNSAYSKNQINRLFKIQNDSSRTVHHLKKHSSLPLSAEPKQPK